MSKMKRFVTSMSKKSYGLCIGRIFHVTFEEMILKTYEPTQLWLRLKKFATQNMLSDNIKCQMILQNMKYVVMYCFIMKLYEI